MKIIRPVAVTQTATLTRAGTATYIDKTGVLKTAAANAIRIAYNPDDLTAPPYILAEGAATNLIVSNAWVVTGQSTTSTEVAPDGTTTATKISASSGEAYISQSFTPVVTGPYTASVWLKLDSTSGAISQQVSLSLSGSLGTVSNVVTVTPAWKRFSVMIPNVDTSATYFQIGGDGTIPAAGSPILTWGAQLETGNYPTSYTATTRAADVVTGNGLLYSNVPENDYPAWNANAVYGVGDRVLDLPNKRVLESITGDKYVVTGTANSPSLTFTDKAIAFAANTRVIVSSTGTLPTGLVAATVYYTTAASTVSAVQLSASSGGTTITPTTAGTGVITLTVVTNVGKPITDTANWIEVGSDNRWSMFDQSITSQTTNADEVVVAIVPGSRVDSVVGLNLLCGITQVTLSDVQGRLNFSKSVNMTSNSGVNNWYAFMYEPIIRKTECLIGGIPVGASIGGILLVRLSNLAGTAAAGGVIIGLSKNVGVTESSAKVGQTDYSVKTRNDFGKYTVTPRAFSKKADFTFHLPSDNVDVLYNLLATYRTTPVVFVGSNDGMDQYNSAMIYGFYKDFSIDIAYQNYSICTMSVEGLT